MQLKITLRSAQIFKNAPKPFFTKMHLYAAAAVVGVGSSPSPPQRTTTDMHGGATPFWWFPMDFNIDEEPKKLPTSAVVVRIKCRRSVILGADKCVGAVQLPVKALLNYYWRNSEGNQPANIAVTILSPSGKPRGVLYLSYMFGEGSVGGGAAPLLPPYFLAVPSALPLPPYFLAVPSAPPLQDFEDHDRYPAPVVAVPSAPYLQEEFMSH